MTKMGRRNLLKGGLATAGAGALTVIGTSTQAQTTGAKSNDIHTFDTVVVGAGLAGLCCALEASEQGANVVLIEKMGRPDGTTMYSSGWIAAVGSGFQKDYPDTEEAFFNDMMALSGNRSDPELIRAYAKEAGAGLDWLAGHGVPFKLWANLPAPELSRCVIAVGDGITGGSKIIRTLLKVMKERNITLHCNTKARELITNDKLEVIGVRCQTPKGQVDYMAKGGVVLTTGGYAANPEMVCKYIGQWATRLVLRGSPYITGENIIMGQQVDAYMVNMDQFYAGPMTPKGSANPSPLMHAGYGIQINSQGKRFVEETWLQVPKAKAIAQRTPDNVSYMLIGQDADNNDNILSNTIKRFKRIGFEVYKGETIEEVAKAAGLPVENVVQTVKEFNEAVKSGNAAKLDPPYLYDEPHALETGPYYLVPAAGGIASTFGGPKIDKQARVVNFERRPIPGLYAAGAAAGGVWYQDDIGGNQLGGCMVFGRIAGRETAARAKNAKETT